MELGPSPEKNRAAIHKEPNKRPTRAAVLQGFVSFSLTFFRALENLLFVVSVIAVQSFQNSVFWQLVVQNLLEVVQRHGLAIYGFIPFGDAAMKLKPVGKRSE